MTRYIFSIMIAGLSYQSYAQKPGVFNGQGPIKGVSTEDKPVEKQWKGIFKTNSGKVFFSNDFVGARLNGVEQLTDSTFTLLIKPENQPVNGSPWYAFKVWSKEPARINLKFTYPGGYRHRYEPKLSKNGKDWTSTSNDATQMGSGSTERLKDNITIDVGSDTLWIAAQELLTSKDAVNWAEGLKRYTKISKETIGTTKGGKPLLAFNLGNERSKKHILILGRQHPPEVTGQLAMQAFAEALLNSGKLSQTFLKDYQVHIIPIMNPDGVDEGFWRHNLGGVDQNRDWASFNQPETKAVKDYLARIITDKNEQLVFGIDFHSTHDDIYYIVDPKLKSKTPGLINSWLKNTVKNIPDYAPNIKPLYDAPPTYTSFSYLYETFGAEALVYEIGDRTSRDFIKEKAKVSAVELIKLLEK